MLRIGFVDHHLNNYHANVFLKLLHDDLAEEEVRVVAAWESDPAGEDWCEKNGVPRLGSITEVVQAADAIILLAPDNIEAHLALCRDVLKAGKPTFIDKMLAMSLEDSREIVRLAEASRTPIFSSSALRHNLEVEELMPEITERPTEVYARGMGKWHGYGIHTLTMAQWLMGTGVRRLIDTGTPACRLITLDYGDRLATVEVRQAFNTWEFGAKVGEKYLTGTVKDYGGFYRNQMKAAVRFFKTGTPPVPVEEALEAVAVHEAADRSQEAGRIWMGL